jgi:hypothetical protein
MPNFVVNARSRGQSKTDYVLLDISTGCNHMKLHVAWIKLGNFPSAEEAFVAASRRFPNVTRCEFCCS